MDSEVLRTGKGNPSTCCALEAGAMSRPGPERQKCRSLPEHLPDTWDCGFCGRAAHPPGCLFLFLTPEFPQGLYPHWDLAESDNVLEPWERQKGPVFTNAGFHPQSPFLFPQTVQILCGMMVLSFGIMLASASFSPNFTQVTSTLLNSAYPFIGPFFVSRVSEEGRMWRRGEEDANSLDFPPATLLCLICQEQGVNGEACSPVCVVQEGLSRVGW